MNVPSFLLGESRTRLLQGIAVGAVLTVAAGFNWFGPGFGWATGGTVDRIANKRAEAAVIAILAPICAEKFLAQPDVAARKAAFAKIESWKTPVIGQQTTNQPRERVSQPSLLLISAGERGC